MSLGPTGNEKSHVLQGVTISGGFAHEGPGSSSGNVRRSVYLTNDSSATLVRQQALMEAQGYYAETYPRAASLISSVTTTQEVYYTAIGLAAGDVVSNLLVMLQVVGTTTTLAKVGLYSKANVLLASSADVSSVVNGSAGPKVIPLTAPLVVPTTDGYWAAFLAVSAVTMPTLWRSFPSPFSNGLFGSASMGASATQTGQADLPATATPVYAAGGALSVWMGVS
jgi:hypothetical protein